MAKNPKLTESTYKAIKIMLNGGATYEEIMEYLNVSKATVGRVKQTENYQEYQKDRQARAFMAKKATQEKKATEKAKEAEELKPVEAPPQVVEHRQSVTVIANHYMMEQLQEQTRLLTLISNKLAFIVDQLT